MADITVADFRARFGTKFTESVAPDATVQVFIAEAYEYTDVSRLATLHMVAHLLALAGLETTVPDGGSGVIASEEEGGERVTYRTMSETGGDEDVWLEQTEYGRRVMFLEKRNPTSVAAVIVA